MNINSVPALVKLHQKYRVVPGVNVIAEQMAVIDKWEAGHFVTQKEMITALFILEAAAQEDLIDQAATVYKANRALKTNERRNNE